jgi:hypothetical protein
MLQAFVLLVTLLPQPADPQPAEALPFAMSEPRSERERTKTTKELHRWSDEGSELQKRLRRTAPGTPSEQKLEGEIAEWTAEMTPFLREKVETYGWFPAPLWNYSASWHAGLLAVQAESDPELQRRILVTIDPLVKRGEVSLKTYAYLYDTVAAAEGRPQRYATKGRCTSQGTWEPLPLEDPLAVDTLRNEAGLEPLEDYAAYEAKRCVGDKP